MDVALSSSILPLARPFGFLFPSFLALVLDSINPPVTGHSLANMFLYEVFEHVCSLQQFSPQPRETESLLVTFVTEVTLFSRRVELGT